jgi:very-short-patch-repair endonuclease
MPELLRKSTRNKFDDYFANNIKVKEIAAFFEDEDILPKGEPSYNNKLGERRNLLVFYYSPINWKNIDDVNKILKVYSKVLQNIDDKISDKKIYAYSTDEIQSLSKQREDILTQLKKDNIEYVNDELQFTNFSDGVKDKVKNIVFAVYDAKPHIVIEDWASNNIKIVEYEDKCLVYDLPIDNGLSFQDLFNWYKAKYIKDELDTTKIKDVLYKRLLKGEQKDVNGKEKGLNQVEKLFFDTYLTKFIKDNDWNKVPALIPQIYLHYDPKTVKELEKEGKDQRLKHQRMDFLMLFSNSKRIVIEIDGKQHYADGDVANPKLYAEMVKYDRWMRLKGYEVYRFGGYELTTSINKQENVEKLIEDFFNDLFKKYNLDFKD